MHATADPITTNSTDCQVDSPFVAENEVAYQNWRAAKLDLRARVDPLRVFSLGAVGELPQAMLDGLREQVAAFNFILFESGEILDKPGFVALGRQFGLVDLDLNLGADADGVSSLHAVAAGDERAQYIPYTNRALNWHTDGYYNPPTRRINAFALYCVQAAGRGGDNYLFDHEYMYLLLRDQAPDLLAALMCDDMMQIPANVQGHRVIRAAESGPVFSLDLASCVLHMRYTSRPRNIVWKADKRSESALNLVREILLDKSAQVGIRLQSGQGMICNNLLHGRQAYQDADDEPARLVYRTRYHDAIGFHAPAVTAVEEP